MNREGLYIRRFREGEEPKLLSVHKWAQKLMFSELGRYEWGYAGIERTEDLKSYRNQAFRRAVKFSQPLRKLAFNLLKNCTLPKTTPAKQNTNIMKKSTEK